jgi:hypothetical protein
MPGSSQSADCHHIMKGRASKNNIAAIGRRITIATGFRSDHGDEINELSCKVDP